MAPQKVVVNDTMQQNYVYYRTAPMGKDFHPSFTPDLTPKIMLAWGVFGGKYMTDCKEEFPRDWFTHAKLSPKYHDPALNFFKISASKSLAYWQKKGWIYEEDPRGWFQWYCRYYSGRRCKDDERQIKRWKGMKRHIGQLQKNCDRGDLSCRPRQRQTLLHWAYDSTKL